jgi:hypothetical protein
MLDCMFFCYLDESGGAEPPDRGRDATPVMVIVGLVVDAAHVPALTRDFLALKRRHFPGLFGSGPALDHIKVEVKGSEILQMTRSGSRDRRRQASRFRAELLDLADAHGCRILGRVWVKEQGKSLKPAATYCYAVQDIAVHFSQYLRSRSSEGLLIADGRGHQLNVSTAHSVFTQKWRTAGDPYPAMAEVPLFAESDNHAGLQMADLVASALVFPMAAAAYCSPRRGAVHSSRRYHEVQTSFGRQLKALQYRYRDETGRWRGGLVVSDNVGQQSGSALFGS